MLPVAPPCAPEHVPSECELCDYSPALNVYGTTEIWNGTHCLPAIDGCPSPPPPTMPPPPPPLLPATTAGDPVTDFRGRRTRYWLPLDGSATMLLAQGDAELWALPFETHEGEYIREFRLLHKGREALKVAVLDGAEVWRNLTSAGQPLPRGDSLLRTLEVVTFGRAVRELGAIPPPGPADPHVQTMASYDPTTAIGPLARETVIVELVQEPPLTLRISSQKVVKTAATDDAEQQVLGMHLDFELELVPSRLRGVLPEIWGEAQMSWGTAALLEPPHSRPSEQLVALAAERRRARRGAAPSLWARPQPEAARVHLCVLSDRIEAIKSTILSSFTAKSLSTSLQWHVFTSAGKARVLDELAAAGVPVEDVRVFGLDETVDALVSRGVDPVWAWDDWQQWLHAGADDARWRTEASLREFPSSRDPKHAHPLNLLRLYLAEVPALQHLERVLLVDDDVLLQRDPRALFDAPLAHQELLQTSCQMFRPATREDGKSWLNYSNAQFTYAQTQFIGSVSHTTYELCNSTAGGVADEDAAEACAPAALEPTLRKLRATLNAGRPARPLRDELAWNFGLSLLPLARWREQRLEKRVTHWFRANSLHRLFAPDSVESGLGLPYLIFAGEVGCWPEGTVLDGLGHAELDDLVLSGIEPTDLGRFAALHFAGPRKLLLDERSSFDAAALQLATVDHLQGKGPLGSRPKRSLRRYY